MRSRYSAYALGEIDYIVSTQVEEPDRPSVERWSKDSEWLGLEVVEACDDVVEFVARYRNRNGDKVEHRERSKFVQHEGRWLYSEGTQPTVRVGAKVGRNDPCPCGSGKKHKKCCGA